MLVSLLKLELVGFDGRFRISEVLQSLASWPLELKYSNTAIHHTQHSLLVACCLLLVVSCMHMHMHNNNNNNEQQQQTCTLKLKPTCPPLLILGGDGLSFLFELACGVFVIAI